MPRQAFGQPGIPGDNGETGKSESVMALVSEAVALYFRIRAASEDIHADSRLSGAMRGVIRDLHRNGPQTVPQMARRRPVTRQHIQAIVNDLQRLGMVELAENPRHKRSHLVQLTAKGERMFDDIVRREQKLLERVDIPLSREDLDEATRVLDTLRQTMEQDEWRAMVQSMFYEDGAIPPNPWIDDPDDDPAEGEQLRTIRPN